MDNMNFVLLGASYLKNKWISGCNYDILDNQIYADSFFYQGIGKFREKMFMRSSDIVAMVAYLGESTTLSKEKYIEKIKKLIVQSSEEDNLKDLGIK